MTASIVCAYLHDKVVMVMLYPQNHPNMSIFILQPSSRQCNMTPMKLSITYTAQPVMEVENYFHGKYLLHRIKNEGIRVFLKYTG
jgi:hypothetical protein